MEIKKIKEWIQKGNQFEVINQIEDTITRVKRVKDGTNFGRLDYVVITRDFIPDGFSPVGVLAEFNKDLIHASVFSYPVLAPGDGSFFNLEINCIEIATYKDEMNLETS